MTDKTASNDGTIAARKPEPPKQDSPKRDERRERLAAALRENLKKRKAQSRERERARGGGDTAPKNR
ncbi:MAG: hypothetical protein KIT00_13930 [Rhodospirillales bacterium]|nr:hypothetical protein [Rhodospirillales bacterium]